MAKNAAAEAASNGVYVVKNMDSGSRDYPLADGGSIYLPARHKGAKWPEIKESQFSPALRRAIALGHVKLERKEG